MKDKKRRTFLIFSLTAIVCPSMVSEAGADPSSREIVSRAIENQFLNLEGAEMQMVMVLRNKQGETRERRMFTITQKKNGLNRTLTRFISPADVAGTAFLFIENKGRDDDQYMYLPALKIVRRIVGSQKDASFMGSDFTYADLESRDLESATYKRQADGKVGKSECYVIDAIPKNRESYSRLRVWIRKKDLVFLRTKFFDRAGKLQKILFVKTIKAVGNTKILSRFKLTNKQTGHSTFVALPQIKVRTDIPPDKFTKRALKKR